ncbi:hypothetical protein [Serratia proteamaculans]|uniref:hypothetical protein n=1 Tax=Serratia proteamaculans TaxID=28151 RepID=UPI0021771E96|nr:hypothetical protein [Serratia proteamaculans]CAI1573803.1 Uncharacterised protein [Serratia proteamaculans]
MTILVEKRMKSPMYKPRELGQRARRNHWYVTEIDKNQPKNQIWKEWWISKGLGEGNEHIKWRSTCVVEGSPDPYNPKSQFEVEFHFKGVVYHLQFNLAPTGPNK